MLAISAALVTLSTSATAANAHSKPACAPTESVNAAAALARSCGARVELSALQTETGQAFVNPDGTTTYEEFAYPQRARKADGSWSPLDPTLVVNPDGALSPRASIVDVAFSAGGAGPLVTAQRNGKRVNLSWPGRLPTPVVSGATATYPNVLNNVDLVLTATGFGFGEVLVVRDAAAAADPRLRKISLGTSTSGLRWDDSDGQLRAVDVQGRTVLAASAPLMWDSSDADSSPRGPGQHARTASIGVSVDSGQIALTPDAGALADPAMKYPLYLDPTVGWSAWTMINSQFTTQSYWSYDKQDCPPAYSGGWCAKVGQIYGGTMDYRSIFQFSSSQWSGKQVLGSKFSIDLLHSASCTASSTELHPTGSISSSTNWSNHSGTWGGVTASVSNQDCNDARVLTEFSSTALTDALASAGSTITWGLKAATESSDSGWKKFDATTAKLVVTTNDIPTVATNVTVDGKACATGTGRPYVATQTPSFRAVLHDANPDNLTGYFEWSRIRHDGSYGPAAGQVVSTQIHDGETALATPAAGVLDQSFAFVATGDWDKDGYPDVLARDSVGDVYLLPGSAGGILQTPVLWGWGYSGYTWAGLGDWDKDGFLDSIVREDATGALWLYPGHGRRNEQSGIRYQIGSGWNGFTFAGVTDWDRDGFQDIVTIDPGGVEWLYPGEGTHTGSTQARVQLGSGWTGYTPFGTIDWDRDGKPDMIARDPSSGQLWLYIGSGVRSAYTGSPYRYEIGSGWGGYLALTTPDVNADGKADLVAQQPSVTNWFYYPGSGSTGYGGSRWTAASRGIPAGAQYAFHVTTSDGVGGWSGWGGWCEFEVDTVAPALPSVTADVYTADCQSCGSVGQTGRFTFGDTATDVATYLWGFSSPPTNSVPPSAPYVDWTPPSGGAKTLYVVALDKAGNQSATKTYQFYVAPPSNALARWLLNDPAGATTLADDTGNGKTAHVNGGTLGATGRIAPGADGLSRTAMSFDGSGLDASTTGPAIADTSKSFSVAAWVKLGDDTASRAALTQGGTNNSAFLLEYVKSGTTRVWKFTAPVADSSSTTYPGANGTSSPQPGVWTHLVGTYDSAAQTMRLYVNGTLEATATGIVTWKAGGPLRIGDTWSGSLAEVQVWNRVLAATEVSDLSDPVKVGSVGYWAMSDVGPGPTYDASGYYHDLNFYPQPTGGPQIPPAGSGQTGTGLSLDGVDDYAATDFDPDHPQVLHTDQSFTVSAWVWINTGTDMAAQNRTAVAQDGVNVSGFFLGYASSGGSVKWKFGIPRADVLDPAMDSSFSSTALTSADQGRWIHLVGVYDAQTGSIRLYVNGALAGSATRTAGTAWDATGALTIGRAWWGPAGGQAAYADNWPGSIDEVRVYQGAVADVTRIP